MNSRWLFFSQHNTYQGVSVSYVTEIMGENDEVWGERKEFLELKFPPV